jgi:hypothetical protein
VCSLTTIHCGATGAQASPKQQGHLAVWQAVESCEGLVGVIGHAVVVC